jgi:hypothetical protein
VLLLGRLKDRTSTLKLELTDFSANDEIESLVERYEIDLESTLHAFKRIVEEAKTVGKSKISMYGLSSYAFRLLNALNQVGLLEEVEFYGDSDPRLAAFGYEGRPILKKDDFFEKARSSIDSGYTLYVIVFAINSYRIVEMFNHEFKFDGVKVVALPPDSQNRQDY